MIEYLEVGKIVNTRGIKGELKVIPLTDNPERFDNLESVYVQKEEGLEEYRITGVSYSKSFVYLKLKGIDDIDAAEKLKGLSLKVHRSNAVKLPEDTYFICDIVDMDVYEDNGNLLGKITDVLKTGSNDVYVVKGEDGKEILIPALKSTVNDVDIMNKRMTVTLPEGLL